MERGSIGEVSLREGSFNSALDWVQQCILLAHLCLGFCWCWMGGVGWVGGSSGQGANLHSFWNVCLVFVESFESSLKINEVGLEWDRSVDRDYRK